LNLPLQIPELTPTLAPCSPQFLDLHSGSAQGETGTASDMRQLADGLLAAHASVSPKYFYDALGSKLFEAITALDEYYPTRVEASIFEAHHRDFMAALQQHGIHKPCLIDLGAGNCAKAAYLMQHLLPSQYVPVDISVDFVREAAGQLQKTFPALNIVGLGMDFSSQLELPKEVQRDDRVFFYPGSSLGNFAPSQALQFLQRITDPAQGNARGLLLGIDLVKDSLTLQAAYDDALGVTGAFNKNMLLNINRLLQSDFDVRQWDHVALFNEAESRIEMHLEANCDLTVRWSGHQRHFKCGERIHSESSYKYSVEGMTDLLKRAGFSQIKCWTDPKNWFAVFWAAV
jgi:dimethylhistidine N-methyltransferase